MGRKKFYSTREKVKASVEQSNLGFKMRFFKHGDVLVIAVPESLRQKLKVTENDEYEFVEIEDGLIALVRKNKLSSLLSDKVLNGLKKSPTDWIAQGYLVLEDEGQAKVFSQQFEKQIKSGKIKGVRGFDKKFYLVTNDFYEFASDKVLVRLKDGTKTAVQLAQELQMPLNGCLTTLYLLKEEGEILEKKRGEFSLVR